MKIKSKTYTLLEDLWLFSNRMNDQTHTVKRVGDKVKVFFSNGFGSVYEQKFGIMLSGTLNGDKGDFQKYLKGYKEGV